MSDNLLFTAILPHPPIMVPAIGRENIEKVKKTVSTTQSICEEIVQANPDTIVFITPHSIFNPYNFSIYTEEKLYGDFRNFGAPNLQLRIKNDTDFVRDLKTNIEQHFEPFYEIPESTMLDHGTCVPLYFLAKAGFNKKIVVINYCAIGRHDHLRFGKHLKEVIDNSNQKFALIASGDLSHRLNENAPGGYEKNAIHFDEKFVDGIKNGDYDSIINIDDVLRETAGECGYSSTMIAFGALDKKPHKNKVYSYEAPFGVGYLVASL